MAVEECYPFISAENMNGCCRLLSRHELLSSRAHLTMFFSFLYSSSFYSGWMAAANHNNLTNSIHLIHVMTYDNPLSESTSPALSR